MGFFDSLFGSPKPQKKRNSFITYDNSYFRDNDESLDIREDMFSMRSRNRNADLSSHFDWERKNDFDEDRRW